MRGSLVRFVYVSRNIMEGDYEHLSQQIEQILDNSRSNNSQAGITGALMFNSGLFAQVLEGPAEAVEQTFERIQCDQRHADISLVLSEPVSERSFEQWSMAYIGTQAQIQLRPLDHATTPGFETKRLDGNFIHETLRTMLLEADKAA